MDYSTMIDLIKHNIASITHIEHDSLGFGATITILVDNKHQYQVKISAAQLKALQSSVGTPDKGLMRLNMGYYQQKAKHNTAAGRKDPKYIEIFDRMRDMEYTVSQSKLIAQEACEFLKLHPDWTTEQAIKEVLN